MASFVEYAMPIYGQTFFADDAGNFSFVCDFPDPEIYKNIVVSVDVTFRLTGLTNPAYLNWGVDEPTTPDQVQIRVTQDNPGFEPQTDTEIPGDFEYGYAPFGPWGIVRPTFNALPRDVFDPGVGWYAGTTVLSTRFGTEWAIRSTFPLSRGFAPDHDEFLDPVRYWVTVRFNFAGAEIPPLRLNQRTDGLGFQGHSRQNQLGFSGHGASESTGTRLGGHNTYV